MSSKIKTGLVCYLLDSEVRSLSQDRENALFVRDEVSKGNFHRGKDEPFHSADYYAGMAEGYNEAMGRLLVLKDMIKD